MFYYVLTKYKITITSKISDNCNTFLIISSHDKIVLKFQSPCIKNCSTFEIKLLEIIIQYLSYFIEFF